MNNRILLFCHFLIAAAASTLMALSGLAFGPVMDDLSIQESREMAFPFFVVAGLLFLCGAGILARLKPFLYLGALSYAALLLIFVSAPLRVDYSGMGFADYVVLAMFYAYLASGIFLLWRWRKKLLAK